MNSVCIAGASGFLGRNLADRLRQDGFIVSNISREDFKDGNIQDKVKNVSIVINLVGESIAGLWTGEKRKRIYESRILSTKKLVQSINLSGENVKLLIQVSGVGIYDRQHKHTEESKSFDTGFLSQVIHDWEGELNGLEDGDVRVVILRLGIVLDKEGGILKKLLYPLKFGFGFGVKSEDYFPFIQLDDLMSVFLFCIEKENISGIVNVTTPDLTKINQFFRELVRVKKRRFILWFGKHVLRLLMGESSCLLTSGQQVIPEKLLRERFEFRYGNIEDALIRACN